MSDLTRAEPRPGIWLLTLNRPDRLNAMNTDLVDELHDALDDAATDTALRVVVLTGAGRGFCAGLDLREGVRVAATADRGRPQNGMAIQERIASLVPKIRNLPVPVVAAVNGPASGGGLALALVSDVRVAAESARFNVAFVRIGLSGCDVGVSWLLPRVIGTGPAFELLLTGRQVESEEALRLGLVTRIVPDGDVVDAALAVAEQIAANSPMGVRMTKQVMWSQLEVGSLQAGIDLENRTQVLTSFTEDMGEAVAAFLERRDPRFSDR